MYHSQRHKKEERAGQVGPEYRSLTDLRKKWKQLRLSNRTVAQSGLNVRKCALVVMWRETAEMAHLRQGGQLRDK